MRRWHDRPVGGPSPGWSGTDGSSPSRSPLPEGEGARKARVHSKSRERPTVSLVCEHAKRAATALRGTFEGVMSDQADGLRQLVQARSGPSALADPPGPAPRTEAPPGTRSLLLTSGKGGVGTSNLALNLAIALG